MTHEEEFDQMAEMSAISKELGVEDPELKPLTRKLLGNCSGELVNYGDLLISDSTEQEK